MKHIGLLIADLHIGAFSVEKLYHELENTVFQELRQRKENGEHIDFVISLGDYFDHRLYLNDTESMYAEKILSRLFEECDEDTKFRFVYGTEGHEWDQYKTIELRSKDRDLKIIKHVCDEYLFDDMRVLYIPEEQVSSKDEYYKEAFADGNEYDFVFGHGVIREAMKEAALSIDMKSGRRKPPVFTTAELDRITKYFCVFGHYHNNAKLSLKTSYLGSFSRWKYGEEDDKKFAFLEVGKHTASLNEVPNHLAETFKTIGVGYDDKVFKDNETMEKELTRMQKLVENEMFDNMRLVFSVPSSIENPEFFLEYVKEKFKTNNNIKVQMKNGYVEERKKQAKKEISEENNKYGSVLEEPDITHQVANFIEIEYGKKIDLDRISAYLFSPFPFVDIVEF